MFNRIRIAAFYKFVPLPDYESLRSPLLEICRAAGVRGSILLAAEGINACIAGEASAVTNALAQLQCDARFADLQVKDAWHDSIPFRRLKVRLKQEIVALKIPGIDPRQQVGTYVEPDNWNALISQDDVLVIDARNDYEVRLGSFRGALNPGTEAFSELSEALAERLDPTRHKRLALFCTGGIRCEKATALLLARGFDEVYHLRGGILQYLDTVPAEESLWEGKCFVFDERGAVGQVATPPAGQT